MDRDTLRNLLIAAMIFFAVMVIGPKLLRLPPPQETKQTEGEAWAPGDRPIDSSRSAERAASPSGPDRLSTGTPSPEAGDAEGGFAVMEADGELTVVIGSEPMNGVDEEGAASPYRMRLTLSNVGAAVESVTMTDHAELLHSDTRYQLLSPVERDDGTRYRSLAIEKINVDGVDLNLHDKKWNVKTWDVGGETRDWMETNSGQRVEFFIDIHQGGRQALRLSRRFTLPPQPKESGKHDLKSELSIEPLSESQTHRVIVTYRGGVGIDQADTRIDDRVLDVGIRPDGSAGVVGKRETHANVTKKQLLELYSASAAGSAEQLSWAATGNKYFTCTLAPLAPNGKDEAEDVTEVSALDLDGDATTNNDVTVRFVMRGAIVAPGGRLTYPVDIYLGQKDADAFRTVRAYKSRNYYYQISQGFGWCTFTWLVELMIWLLNGLYAIVGDYGVAIIILVIIVRAALHPITKKGQVNMVRMQQRMGEFAPQLEEFKKKYGNDKQRLQQETMKLYREHGINPAGQMLTCLPMMLQMPIWVALYISLSNNILMRHEGFLFTWIDDLTAPDALFTFGSPIVIPILRWTLPAFNLLPILVSVFMYTQQKMQPKPKPNPNATDQQRQQQEMMQKMMPMMSIMMLLIFYKMPSGLNLYIMSSSLFGTIEQWWIRKHIKEREKTGTLHKPKKVKDDRIDRPKRPGKSSLFKRLQQMAENAQKQAHRTHKAKSRR